VAIDMHCAKFELNLIIRGVVNREFNIYMDESLPDCLGDPTVD